MSGNSFFGEPASAAAVGTTVGVSFVFINVAVVLIIFYLRAKRKAMKEYVPEFSDLYDSESDSSSYLYYVYEYEYASSI